MAYMLVVVVPRSREEASGDLLPLFLMIRPRRESHPELAIRNPDASPMANKSFLVLGQQRRRSLPLLTVVSSPKSPSMGRSRSPLSPESTRERSSPSPSPSSPSLSTPRGVERTTPGDSIGAGGETSVDRPPRLSSIHAAHNLSRLVASDVLYSSDGLQGCIQQRENRGHTHGQRRTDISSLTQHQQRFPQQSRQSVQALPASSSRIAEALRRGGLGSPLQRHRLSLNVSNLSATSPPSPISARPASSSPSIESLSLRQPRHPARFPVATEVRKERRRPLTASGALESGSRMGMTHQATSTTSARSQNAELKSKTPQTPEECALQLSTTDRTILKELIQSLAVRNSQFTSKNGKKHHPFAKQSVPYPRNYDRSVLDLDTWEILSAKAFSKTVIYHSISQPPSKVLDLGCGSGTWILHAAELWKQAHFVGLDIVPLYPDLHRTGQVDLAKRVTWVQHNFLETLPFPNEEFDFVLLRRIARGVPENKWDELFEELLRVMKPGAAIEILEEDLYLPGSVTSLSLSGNDSSTSLSNSTNSNMRTPRQSTERGSLDNSGSASRAAPRSDRPSGGAINPGLSSTGSNHDLGSPSSSSPTTHSDPKSTQSSSRREGRRMRPKTSASHSASSLITEKFIRRRARSASSPNTRASKDGGDAKHDHPLPSPPEKQLDALMSSFPVSLPFSSVGGLAMPNINTAFPSTTTKISQFQSFAKIKVTLPGVHSAHASPVTASATSESGVSATAVEDVSVRNDISTQDGRNSSERDSADKPVLYHPSPRNMTNPRDHSLLERIYRETHEARFINLSPLALLPNLLNLYFTGIVSHPPTSVTFPPPLPTFFSSKNNVNRTDLPSTTIARDTKTLSNPEDGVGKEEESALPTYVLVDSLRTPDGRQSKSKGRPKNNDSKTKRSKRSHETKRDGSQGVDEQAARQETIERFEKFQTTQKEFKDFPPHDLYMHLSARVQEVVSCAEAMWEWVEEEQARWREKEEMRVAAGRQEHQYEYGVDEQMAAVRRMTRQEFESMLSRFEMDMRRTISMDRVLGCYVGWHPSLPLYRSTEEKNFDKACRRWEGKSGSQQSSPIEPRDPYLAKSQGREADESGEHVQRVQQLEPGAEVRFSRTFRIFCAWKPAA